MSAERRDGLDSLIHDMNSKCASLKTAVSLLRTASSAEARELLALMKRQAGSIMEDIAAYEESPRPR